MRVSLIPRNHRFFELFDDLARWVLNSSELLVDMLEHFENVDMKAGRLKEIEHEADNVTHEIYRLVHQTFVTPFDREDITGLAQSMDDVIDFVEAVATSMRVYRVARPTQPAAGLADITRLQSVQIERAIASLGKRGSLKEILEQVREINRLE